jgi:hypothetical protein
MFSLIIICSLSQLAGAVIYGVDNRQEIHQVAVASGFSSSLAIAVGNNLLQHNQDSTYKILGVQKLKESSDVYACSEERFADQPTLGVCTGFLLTDTLLITAGHCLLPNGILDHVDSPFCQGFSWFFNYSLPLGDLNHVPESQIYHCRSVIHAENLDLSPTGKPNTLPGNDFAIVELDRPVSSSPPFKVSKTGVRSGDNVFTLGFPSGLPAKFSGWTEVLDVSSSIYFSANLNTEEGNSGGPVLNQSGEVVGILVSGHPVDYYEDKSRGCYKANVCDGKGLHCDENPGISQDQVSNFVQRIESLTQFLQ